MTMHSVSAPADLRTRTAERGTSNTIDKEGE